MLLIFYFRNVLCKFWFIYLNNYTTPHTSYQFTIPTKYNKKPKNSTQAIAWVPSIQCIFIIPQFTEYVRGVYYPELCHENPKRCKIRQIDAVGSSKNVVRIGVVTTVGILAVNINLSYKILFVIFYLSICVS